jgi:hypothetical protein
MTDTAKLSTRAATVVNPAAMAEIDNQGIAVRIATFPRIARGRMLAFLLASLIALVVGTPGAAAHDGWFARVCPAKTETNRIYLAFSGNRLGFSWSWIKGRTADEIDLPGRFRSVARIVVRGSTTSTPSNLQPHAYVCVGFRDHIVQRMEFDDHEDHQKNWNDTDDCAC